MQKFKRALCPITLMILNLKPKTKKVRLKRSLYIRRSLLATMRTLKIMENIKITQKALRVNLITNYQVAVMDSKTIMKVKQMVKKKKLKKKKLKKIRFKWNRLKRPFHRFQIGVKLSNNRQPVPLQAHTFKPSWTSQTR